MEMGNGFPRVGTIVDDQAVASAVQTQQAGDFGGLEEEVAEHRLIGGACLAHAHNRLLRHDQYVRGRLRLEVVESEDKVILVHDPGRQLAGNEFLKESHANKTFED